MYRVHGLELVEKYFDRIPQNLKRFDVYTALLNCYCKDKSVEKAESIMKKLRDIGIARTPLSYNILMNLYYQMGSWEKLDILMHEMEEKGIYCDNYTFSIRLSAYAAVSDSEGIDKIVTRMESDPRIVVNYIIYSVAASGYLKVGLEDKALEMLKKMEECTKTSKNKNDGFNILLKLYAETGKKDELYRIWNLYKEGKVFNRGYMSMMSSLSKFNDIEGAKKIFEEWEARGLSYDFRIPNFLIETYCRNSQLEKAEALLNRGIDKGGIPTVNTWCYLAGAYIAGNQFPKAVEAVKKAISMCQPNWKPSKETLGTCLKYLEGPGNVEEAADIISLLWS